MLLSKKSTLSFSTCSPARNISENLITLSWMSYFSFIIIIFSNVGILSFILFNLFNWNWLETIINLTSALFIIYSNWAGGNEGKTGTSIAPNESDAISEIYHSMRFSEIIPILSPLFKPIECKPNIKRLTYIL